MFIPAPGGTQRLRIFMASPVKRLSYTDFIFSVLNPCEPLQAVSTFSYFSTRPVGSQHFVRAGVCPILATEGILYHLHIQQSCLDTPIVLQGYTVGTVFLLCFSLLKHSPPPLKHASWTCNNLNRHRHRSGVVMSSLL